MNVCHHVNTQLQWATLYVSKQTMNILKEWINILYIDPSICTGWIYWSCNTQWQQKSKKKMGTGEIGLKNVSKEWQAKRKTSLFRIGLTGLLTHVWLFSDPMDCSPPGSSVHGISQARILEYIAISFSRWSFRPRGRTHASCIAGGFFTAEPSGKPIIQNKISKCLSTMSLRVSWQALSLAAQHPQSDVLLLLSSRVVTCKASPAF